MQDILIKWIILTLAILAASYAVKGIYVRSIGAAIFAAAALGVLNTVVRPVLFILTIPITILTLGLFLLILNAVMLKIAAGLIRGFRINGFLPAVWASVIISLVNWALYKLV
ncbi:MAG: phage holin family protein [Deltaproteobacteria bacterium]|nr:phage holin family protein [Deltaproteobacteria bacterium]